VCIGGDGSLTGANLFKQEWSSLLKELVEKSLFSHCLLISKKIIELKKKMKFFI